MKTVLLIILGLLAIIAIITIVCYFIFKSENFKNPISDVKTTNPNDIIDFNYSEYAHLSTSVNPNPAEDPTSLLLLGAFCFKSEGFTRNQWKPEYNNVIEIIKKEIPVRTSPNVHNIDGLLNETKIREAITKDIESFKALSLDKLVDKKDNISKEFKDGVIVGPVYVVFIQNPYYVEHNTITGDKYYKNIYFNNLKNNDYTSSYAVYNDGEYDFSKTLNTNVKTQMLLLYPMYHKTNVALFTSGCDYYNLEKESVDSRNYIRIKGNPNLAFKEHPSFAGINEMLRYFKSLSYMEELKYCDKDVCVPSELKSFSLGFKLSNDNNCFIKCKGSLENENSDLRDITCGCASRLFSDIDDEVTLDIPDNKQYNTKCKSSIDTEIENEKFYIYGFTYRLNENLIVNVPLTRIMLTSKDIEKLNSAINPEKIKSKNGIEMLKLVNRCE